MKLFQRASEKPQEPLSRPQVPDLRLRLVKIYTWLRSSDPLIGLQIEDTPWLLKDMDKRIKILEAQEALDRRIHELEKPRYSEHEGDFS